MTFKERAYINAGLLFGHLAALTKFGELTMYEMERDKGIGFKWAFTSRGLQCRFAYVMVMEELEDMAYPNSTPIEKAQEIYDDWKAEAEANHIPLN